MKKPLILLICFMIFYVVFVAYSDFNKFYSNFSTFKFEILPIVLGLSLASMIVKGIRQQLFFKRIDIFISFKENILLYLAGLSMIMTPGGSGEAIKSYFLKSKHGQNISKTLPVVIIERFHDMISLVAIVIISTFAYQISQSIILPLALALFLLAIFIVIKIKSLYVKVGNWAKKIPIINKFILNPSESHLHFDKLTSKEITAQGFLLSLFAWGLDIIAVYFVFVGFGLDYHVLSTTYMVFSSILFGVISFLPSGIGITEISVVKFLVEDGLEISLATSVMVMIRLVTIWYATIIGFITMKLFLKK